jgi:pfkB family carbohydrate kinase
VKRGLRVDYTTVGHVTVDVMRDGSRRPGGTAFYSALQAARLGLRTLIVTQGVPHEIAELLEPYRGELELEVLPAPQTTTLATRGSGPSRSQRVLAWAGAIDEHVVIDTSILHLAPVARETPGRWRGSAGFVGLTPQGLVRAWSGDSGDIFAAAPERDRIPDRCQAMVMSEHERATCDELIAAAVADGAIVAVTAGAAPATLLCAGGDALSVNVAAVANPTDDVGAGDVFAAAFFIALHEGRTPRLAADFANAAAAVRIGAVGAGAIGGRTAIEARLRAVA